MKRILLFILISISTKIILADEQVYFADEDLKAAVETALKVKNPTVTDMAGLTEFAIGYKDIDSLIGIEHAVNLEIFIIRSCFVKDISPLSELTYLKKLELSRNKIKDISALAKLKQLREVLLGDNQIEDISVFANFKQLREVDLQRNKISDISILSNAKKLERVIIANNNIKNISPLTKLRNLKSVHAVENPIRFGWFNVNLSLLRIRNRGVRIKPWPYALDVVFWIVVFIGLCVLLVRCRSQVGRVIGPLVRWFPAGGFEKCAEMSWKVCIASNLFGLFCFISLASLTSYGALAGMFLIFGVYPAVSFTACVMAILGLFGKHDKKKKALLSLLGILAIPISLLMIMFSYG